MTASKVVKGKDRAQGQCSFVVVRSRGFTMSKVGSPAREPRIYYPDGYIQYMPYGYC